MPIDISKSNRTRNLSQKSINSNYMTRKEALSYAAKMGMTDSIRGIKQIYGQITNSEDLLDALKEKDDKLNQIFNNPEYGSKAFAGYLGAAVFADPVGWIPLIGWGKKAKTLQKGASYGASLGQNVRTSAAIGAGWSGVGYYGEEDITRGEGVLLGGALGGSLGYIVGKISHKLNKSLSPSRIQKQKMAAQELGEDFKTGKVLTPDDTKKAEEIIVDTLEEEGPSQLHKSISGLNIRKNYEEIVGPKVWNMMVANWGSGLVGVASAAGGYSALEDPEASELEKFGAAIALGLGAGLSTKLAGRIKLKGGETTLAELISKGMVDNYGLTTGYIKLKTSTFSEVNSLKQQFLDIIRATDEVLTKDEQQVLYSMIHGVVDDVPQLKGLSDAAKKVIAHTGRELVEVGLLDPKTWRKNAGKYLHRSYDTKMLKSVEGNKGIRAAREFKIIGDELKPRGSIERTTQSAFEKPNSKWQREGYEILDDTDPQNLVVRRQLTKEERVARGEIENASFAIAETGRLMTHDLSVYKLFQNIAKSKYSLDESTFLKQVASGDIIEDAWVKVPESARFKGKAHEVMEYGKLAGQYVPKEIFDDITKLIPVAKDGFSKIMGESYMSLMRLWKKSKTAWNPTVHTNNTMSNVMMYDHANGSYKFIGRGAQELKKGLDGRKDARMFRMAQNDGVFDSDILTRELSDETMGALEKASKELSNAGRNELQNSISYSKRLGNFFRGAYEKTFKKMENFYQAEDQVFRMALYMDRLSKGVSRADAAADARKWFIDYNINAPAINFLKNTATPFISYTYRVIPLLAETAAKRPWKFAKWAALGYTANELGRRYGVGDEEAERRLMDERYKETMYGIPGAPFTTIKTPFASGQNIDVPLYIDTTRFIPGGDIFTMGNKGIPIPFYVPFSESITGTKQMLTLPAPLNPNFGIVGEVLAPMMFGIDPFTHEKLEDLGFDNDEMVKMTHVLKKLVPNFPAPYILPEKYESFSSKKIREAFENKNKRDPYRQNFSNFEAVMSSFGFKLTPMNMQKLLNLNSSSFRRDYTRARQEYFNTMQDYRKNPTPKQREKTQEKIDKVYSFLENSYRKHSLQRKKKAEGGVIQDKYPVPFVKDDPTDRINPFTGKPYQEQMDRLGFDKGGEALGPPKFEKRIARPDPKMFIKDPKSGNPQTHRMAWGNIEGQFIAYPTIVEQDGKLVQYENNTDTMKLMKKNGNYKAFDTKEEAEAYADGGWKTKEFNETYRKTKD